MHSSPRPVFFGAAGAAGAETEGVIPRALARVFASVEQLSRQGWAYTLQASMLEVHNEELTDLLVVPPPVEKNARPDWDRPPEKAAKLDIKHEGGSTTVVGATVVEVTSQAQVEQLLAQASAARSVGRTACNERSSRSHMVFTLRLEGRNAELATQCSGVLNLIDLAGSERLSRSQVTGERLKETQAINKSLSGALLSPPRRFVGETPSRVPACLLED